jgi:hypothetical protein
VFIDSLKLPAWRSHSSSRGLSQRGQLKINLICLAALSFGTITAPARATTLYTNGAISGQIGGLALYGGDQVSDSFALSGPWTILSVTFGEWVAPGTTPETVDWEIGSSAFGSDLGSATGVSLTSSLFCTHTGCGDGTYDVYTSSFTLDLPLADGTYWLTLQNATTSAGLVFWDQNGGPSQVETTCCISGYLSNSFEVDGTVPEPGSVVLGGSGLLLLLAAGLRRAGKYSRGRLQLR